MRNWRLNNKEKLKQYQKTRKRQTNEKTRILGKKYYKKLLDLILKAYGKKCFICQSTERLCLDHLNGEGVLQTPRGRNALYRWVIKHNFPKEFRILCNRCNLLDGMLRNHTILGINGINDLLVLIGIAEIQRRGFGSKTMLPVSEKGEVKS